jgi:hypothetical protein
VTLPVPVGEFVEWRVEEVAEFVRHRLDADSVRRNGEREIPGGTYTSGTVCDGEKSVPVGRTLEGGRKRRRECADEVVRLDREDGRRRWTDPVRELSSRRRCRKVSGPTGRRLSDRCRSEIERKGDIGRR